MPAPRPIEKKILHAGKATPGGPPNYQTGTKVSKHQTSVVTVAGQTRHRIKMNDRTSTCISDQVPSKNSKESTFRGINE